MISVVSLLSHCIVLRFDVSFFNQNFSVKNPRKCINIEIYFYPFPIFYGWCCYFSGITKSIAVPYAIIFSERIKLWPGNDTVDYCTLLWDGMMNNQLPLYILPRPQLWFLWCRTLNRGVCHHYKYRGIITKISSKYIAYEKIRPWEAEILVEAGQVYHQH